MCVALCRQQEEDSYSGNISNIDQKCVVVRMITLQVQTMCDVTETNCLMKKRREKLDEEIVGHKIDSVVERSSNVP